MIVSALDRKMLRDLAHLWAQALAVALVMAAGVATLIIAVGAHRSLAETREAYYDRYRFADIFSSVTRAPRTVLEQAALLPGVSAAEGRIVKPVLLDIEGMREPGSALAISLPRAGEPVLNRLHVRAGRLPEERGPTLEAAVSEGFATAHGFTPGSTFHALINGRKRALTVTAVVLSPEYIYALGPGDLMPDDRRFAVLWMPQRTLEAAFDLDGAVTSVTLKLLKGASEPDAIRRLDALLARYGGLGAYGRQDQSSHAFLDSELQQLEAMRAILPPIFLIVTAFLINMILSRLIALEREHIGLLKAVGYGPLAVGVHYLKLVLAIAAIGILFGYGAGQLLGRGLTRLYGDFFHFPFLLFDNSPDVFLIAAGVTVAAALAGAVQSVVQVVRLPPATAMQPPAPTAYRTLLPGHLVQRIPVSQLTRMMLRHMVRRPLRAGATAIGIALSLAVLISSLFAFDAVDLMIDVTFFQADRQHATLTFTDEREWDALFSGARLPGVLRAEPARTVAARLRNGHYSRRVAITGKPADAELSRVLDADFRPIAVPDRGLLLSDKLADLLRLRTGQKVTVELLDGRRRTVEVTVSATVRTYIGLLAVMDIGELNRLAGEPNTVSGLHLALDGNALDRLYAAVKALPATASITLQRVSLRKFRETLAENIAISMLFYAGLGVVIAFGVVYNSARIQLSERARELASLRVLGFTRAEVSRVLLGELAVLTALAVPLGWAMGYGLAWTVAEGLDTELHRVPFVVERDTVAMATLIVLGATLVSALIVRLRIDRLNLIEVLKTRD